MSDEPMTYCAECNKTAKASQYACDCGACVVCDCDHPTETVLPNGKTYATV